MIFHPKKIWFQEYFALNKSHICNTWKHIKQIIVIIGKRNKSVSDPVQVATGFIGIKLAQKIQPYKDYFTSLFKKNMTNSIFLTDTMPAAIAKLISSLDTKKIIRSKKCSNFYTQI